MIIPNVLEAFGTFPGTQIHINQIEDVRNGGKMLKKKRPWTYIIRTTNLFHCFTQCV